MRTREGEGTAGERSICRRIWNSTIGTDVDDGVRRWFLVRGRDWEGIV